MVFITVVISCHKEENCNISFPFVSLRGYDSAELDTVIVYVTQHDDFSHVQDSFMGKGVHDDIYLPGVYAVTNLLAADDLKYSRSPNSLDNGWIYIMPATKDTFQFRSNNLRVNKTKSTQEPDDCRSVLTEVEINGIKSSISSEDYGIVLRKP